MINQIQYNAWGETRYSSGTQQTRYEYTAQFSYAPDFGLMFYSARWYDSSLGRFAQADTSMPDGTQGYDRYVYANNNPIRYTDPNGHSPACDDGDWDGCPPPSAPTPIVIIVCGKDVACSTGNSGSLDEFEDLGEVVRVNLELWTSRY